MSSIIETGPRRAPSSLGTFFLLTFSATWLLQLPAVLAQRGILPGDPASYLPLAMFGVFGPLAAATILTTRAEGRPGLGRLYGRLLPAKVSWLWYVVALLVPGVLLAGALYLFNLAGRQGPIHFHRGAATLVVGLVIAIAEEVGWRGYALPRMQEKLGPLAAAGLLGVIWTVWHIPMFLGLGIPLSLLLVMLLFFVGGSLTFSWIYNRTGQSLLLVVLAHLGAHLNNSHAALPGEVLPLVVHAIVYAAIGLAAATFDRRAFPLPTRRRPAALRRLT
jgi:membrane protease YdiL (CAAX protease family)